MKGAKRISVPELSTRATHTHICRPKMSLSISSEVQYMTSSSQLSTRPVKLLTTESHLVTDGGTSLLASH